MSEIEITGKRPVVYRCFDASGELLYVGSSMSVFSRLATHFYQSEWFEKIQSVSIEYFDTKSQALAFERRAIREEHPVHNVVYNKKAPFTAGDEQAIKDRLARAIRKAIHSSDMSRQEIAELACCSEAAIRSWEDGRMPSVVNAHMLLSALGRRLVIGDPAGETLDL